MDYYVFIYKIAIKTHEMSFNEMSMSKKKSQIQTSYIV